MSSIAQSGSVLSASLLEQVFSDAKAPALEAHFAVISLT